MGKSSRKPFTWFFISIWLLRLCHQILQFIHIVKAIDDSKIEINLWWQMFVIRSHFCKFFSDNFSNHVESTFWFYFVKHYQFQSIFGIFMIPLYHQSKCVYFMLSLFLSVKILGFILISGLILVLILFGIIGQSSYFFLTIDPQQKTMTISTICVFLPFSSRPNMPISCIICLFHAQFIFDCPNIGFYFDFRSPFGLLPSDFGVHHIGRVRSGIEEVIWVVEFQTEE